MDDKILIKEEPQYNNEISTELYKPCLPHNEAYFETVPEKSELIICDIKQEPLHLSEVPYIRSESQERHISDPKPSVNTNVLIVEDNIKMGIKEEALWQRCSTDNGSQKDEMKSNPDKHETSQDILPLESPRISTEDATSDSNSVTILEVDASQTLLGKNISQGTFRRQKNGNRICDNDHFESKQNISDKSIQSYKNEVSEQSCSPKPSLVKEFISSDTEPYSCDICQQKFTRKSSLRRHIMLHSSTKVHKCDICQQSFKRKDSLQSHELLHSGKKPYKCDHCDRCFTQRSTLQSHMLLHLRTKPYKCETCEKCFTQKSTLQRHKLLHSDLPPHKCEICEKCFVRKSYLEKHTVLHSGMTPYQCDVCEKCFIWKSHLQSHTLIHSGTKPNKCNHCEKSFIRKYHLERHIMIVHGDKKSHKNYQ